jgi:NAD(P)-dependent dehydrogenase (short-subunit alcohol dehydrogenase family)
VACDPPPSQRSTQPLASRMRHGAMTADAPDVVGRDLFDLTGRVAVVTGAASGLGHAIAAGMARYGATVIGADINDAGLEGTVDRIRRTGGTATGIHCDVSDEASVDALYARLDAEFGRVDILVNDAFVPLTRETPEAYPLEAWERSIRVNLTGYFLLARGAGKRMIEAGRGGSIINISSIAGSTGIGRGNFVYSVSKHGVIGLTRELAIEWARHRIRVNAIQPCQFLTPGLQKYIDAAPNPQAVIDGFLRGIPLDRMGDPERDIVGPIVFLASDAAALVTGVVLPVDGGNLAFNAGGSKTW